MLLGTAAPSRAWRTPRHARAGRGATLGRCGARHCRTHAAQVPPLRDSSFMSSANVDLVRTIYAGWERGDFFSSADWAHSEIEFVRAEAPEDPSPSTGLAGMAESARDWLSAWEDYRAPADEDLEIRGGKVTRLVLYWDRARALADLGLALGAGSPDS